MPIPLSYGAATLFIRRSAYERAGVVRSAIDERLGLTPEEFRVEGGLVAIGPVYETEALTGLIDELERLGLSYFDDYFELSGNWPEWLTLFAISERDGAK